MVPFGEAPDGLDVIFELGESDRHRGERGGTLCLVVFVVDAHRGCDRLSQPVDHDHGQDEVGVQFATADQVVPAEETDRRVGQGAGQRLRLLGLQPLVGVHNHAKPSIAARSSSDSAPSPAGVGYG